MSRILVVATGGAGGDLQPLIAVAAALRARGHEIVVLGDPAVGNAVSTLDVAVEMLPPELDLGPRLIQAIRDAIAQSEGDMARAGAVVGQRLGEWAADVARPVAAAVEHHAADTVITSLFGVEVVDTARPSCPWVVVNSTFYVGPNPPRPLGEDFDPRALPLVTRYAALLDSTSLVIHGTDQVFDMGFDGLPPRHHYAGPLGTWEPPSTAPGYLDEPGDPWVLVSISSQLQDDIPVAEMALEALADRPVRVLVTLGPGHGRDELSTIPSNARVEGTVAHAAVLQRSVLFVGHAGHGSVMKALWHGRPMVLVPWGRDQPGVAARAQALGVAEVVPCQEATGETLGAAIDRALTSQAIHERCAREAARLQRTDPPGTAAGLVETLLT